MKNRIYILFIVAVIISCSKKIPVIIVDKTRLDNLNPNDSLSSFTVYNKGNGDLIIDKYTLSCNCTLITLKDSTTIKSNDSLIIPVKISHSKEEGLEKRKVYITFKTNSQPQLYSFYFVTGS